MALPLNGDQVLRQDKERLQRMLDRGIDDMETGRELPLEKAFERITELRNKKKGDSVAPICH